MEYIPSKLPFTSAWETNGNQITSGVPVIWYQDLEMCTDGAGGTIIAWADLRSGVTNDYDIFAQRIDSSGKVLWTSNGVEILPTSNMNNQYNMKLCSDEAGGAIITWQDERDDYGDIYAQRVDSNGDLMWEGGNFYRGIPISVSEGGQYSPQICSDGAGGAIITWYEGSYEIYAQRINHAGNLEWGGGIFIIEADGNSFPYICSDGNGGAIIGWSDERSGNFDVYAQRLDSNGNKLWTASGVEISSAASSQSLADIVSDGNDGAILTWVDDRDYGQTGSDIYSQRVDSSGNALWTTNGVPLSKADDDQLYSKLVNSATGEAIIMWEDERNGSPDNFWDIYAQRIDTSGNIKWINNGIPICTELGTQENAEICSDGAGGAIITWQDGRAGSDIYAQRVNSSGDNKWTPNGTPVCKFEKGQGRPQICASGTGEAIITWHDTRFYSQRDIFGFKVKSSIPTTNEPGDITVSLNTPKSIIWTLFDDFGGGKYRVLANNSLGDYYIVKDWTSWATYDSITINVDTSSLGIFNYTIQYYDTDNQYGPPNTVMINVVTNAAPTSNHPDDINTTLDGSERINWTLSDDFGGGKYRVNVSNLDETYTWIDWKSWNIGENLNVSINRNATGVFNYTIEYYDNENKFGSPDLVNVKIPKTEVLQNTAPTSNHPEDIETTTEGSETIDWILSDTESYGGTYCIMANNSNGDYYKWKDWDSWVDGDTLSIPINRTNPGIYNYTIIYKDVEGLEGLPDTVIVTISKGNGDDDNENKKNGFPFGNTYLVFTLIGTVALVIIIKSKIKVKK